MNDKMISVISAIVAAKNKVDESQYVFNESITALVKQLQFSLDLQYSKQNAKIAELTEKVETLSNLINRDVTPDFKFNDDDLV